MKNVKKELVASIVLFITVIFSMVLLVTLLRERIAPKEVVVDEKLSYIVIKDEAQEKLAREIFKNIENNLTKEGVNLKLNHSIIQELSPVDKKYKGLSDEVKDSISLYNIFNNNLNIASCLKGKLNSYSCKDRVKRIIGYFKGENKKSMSERERAALSITPIILYDDQDIPYIGLKDDNLRANASTITKYIKEKISEKEKGCYETTYRQYVMNDPFKYLAPSTEKENSSYNFVLYLKAHAPSNEASYEAVLVTGLFDEGKICINDLDSPKCDIFIDKLLKDMEKVCREKQIAEEEKEKEEAMKEALNQQKRDNFLKSRGL